jgi:hypothetical protein
MTGPLYACGARYAPESPSILEVLMPRSRFSFRALVSVMPFWTFLALMLSGVVLFISPKGRTATWTNWHLFALDKGQWEGVHSLMAILFLVGGLFHLLKFNRRTIWTYVRRSREEESPFRGAILVSTLAFVGVLAGTISGVPPFSSVMDVNQRFRDGWGGRSEGPPMPHMEELTSREIAQRSGFDPEEACAALRAAGLERGDVNDTMLDIASVNHRAPADLYRLLVPTSSSSGVDIDPPEHVVGSENQGHGAGWGRLTVAEAARQLSLDVDRAIDNLRAHGVTARRGDGLRELAEEHDLRPVDLPPLMGSPLSDQPRN